MIGFHIQNSPQGWLDSVFNLPPNAMVKILTGVERCREVRAANPNVKTWYRWVGEQPLPDSNYEEHAKRWFANFIDETFFEYAEYVDYIQEYNETLANSQSAEEKEKWIALHTAMAKVWRESYRNKFADLSHIRLILCETSIGNSIPWEIASAAQKYDAALGYHPYIVCRNKQISPHDWVWYSGRWETMDADYRARRIYVDWAFGEGGPVLDQSTNWSGWLDPLGGWKHKDCLNGDIERYQEILDYWLQNTMSTQAYKDGRVLGLQLFTSGAPGGSGGQWGKFDLIGDDMKKIAKFSGDYNYNPTDEKPQDDTFKDILWEESIERQTIQLNPAAALQKAIFNAGYVPVESEFWYTINGVEYAAQAAENLKTGARRVYYAIVPNWNDVKWFSQLDLQYWPTDSKRITQQFGENVEYYKDTFGLCCGHNGIDIGANVGQPIYAAAVGVVEKVDIDDNGYGIHVIMDCGNGYSILYAHMARAAVHIKQKIAAGSLIGFAGSTGVSSGPHLHFEIRRNGVAIDPAPYMKGL